jgi:DNA primase
VSSGATLAEALTEGRGVERPFRCHVHEDSNASASVNVLKGVWVCYACGAHGILDEGALVPEAEELIKIIKGELPVRFYAEEWLDLFDAHHPSPYWVERFGEEVARANRCGTDPETGQPTYPVRSWDGRVMGVVRRSDNEKPKYKYPWNVPTSKTLYGKWDPFAPNDVAILVEGAPDVMALQQAGLPDGWSVFGCFGAGIHYPQAMLLAEINPAIIITAFDDDKAGILAAQRARWSITTAPVVSHHWSRNGGNDPGEVPVEARIQGLQETLQRAKKETR